MSSVPDAHDEISRFDIPMHERMRMDKLDARYLCEDKDLVSPDDVLTPLKKERFLKKKAYQLVC